MTRHTRDQQTTNGAGHISDRTPTTPGRQIHLPCFGITVHLAQESSPDSLGRGLHHQPTEGTRAGNARLHVQRSHRRPGGADPGTRLRRC